jgi:hypothetical protein
MKEAIMRTKRTSRKRKNKFNETIKKLAKNEGPVLFCYVAMAIGGGFCFHTLIKLWGVEISGWFWLIICLPLVRLPEAYSTLKQHGDKPYLVRFSIAFKQGFWILPSLMPGLSRFGLAIQEFLESLKKDKK